MKSRLMTIVKYAVIVWSIALLWAMGLTTWIAVTGAEGQIIEKIVDGLAIGGMLAGLATVLTAVAARYAVREGTQNIGRGLAGDPPVYEGQNNERNNQTNE